MAAEKRLSWGDRNFVSGDLVCPFFILQIILRRIVLEIYPRKFISPVRVELIGVSGIACITADISAALRLLPKELGNGRLRTTTVICCLRLLFFRGCVHLFSGFSLL